MVNIQSIEAGKYNILLAEALKKYNEFKQPEWIVYVKTGINKQRPTNELDFWYKRAASILRQIYIHDVVGVQRLRTRYGGRQDRGVKPPRKVKGAGKIIRLILQQSESAGLVEKVKGKKSGRKLTDKGKKLYDKATLIVEKFEKEYFDKLYKIDKNINHKLEAVI
jgi:small subunit ribosomal protein S19e